MGLEVAPAADSPAQAFPARPAPFDQHDQSDSPKRQLPKATAQPMALLDALLRDDPQKRSGRSGPPSDGIPTAPLEKLTTGVEGTALSAQSGPPEDGPQARRRRLLEQRRGLMTDTSGFEAPERDQEARRLQRTIAGAGALSSLVAAFAGDPVAAAPGAGLAQGAQRNVRSMERGFRRRRKAFRKALRQAREQNRELRLSINEALVRGAEREADRQFDREQAQADRRFQTLDREDRQRQEALDDYRDHKQSLEQIKARGRQRRSTARTRAQSRAQSTDEEESGPSLNELRQEKGKIEAQISLRRRQIQEAQSQLQQALDNPETGEGVPENIRERISRLQQDLDDLRGESVALNSEINARAPEDGQSIPEGQLTENRETFMDTLPPGMRPGAGGAGGNQQGRQSPAQDTTRRGAPGQQSRSQGRRDGGQSGSDPIRQEARQQAAKMDTVTQADIDNAIEEFGAGSDEVRVLREVRRIQQSQ